MTIEQLYSVFQKSFSVTTDTRQIKPGDLFFALKGENFNGNKFVKDALDKGAALCVTDEETFEHPQIVKTDDVLATLQQLAAYHRATLKIPVLAITGSNGKTTTKELIHAVLSKKWKTYTTVGNLNNHIGIPLTLLRIKPDAEIAIVEMGANHQKEIESYCKYTAPTHGLITNCGKAHLEGFGGMLGVRKGKGELYDYIRATEGTIFMCSDLDYLREMAAGIKNIITYGIYSGEFRGQPSTKENYLSVQMQDGTIINTHLVGEYNIANVLAAVAVGSTFDVGMNDIEDGISNYIPGNNRSQLLEKNGNTFVLDAYNANPSSMILAVENFEKLNSSHKVVILGGMKEMGNDSDAEHEALIKRLQQYNWEHVILVGSEFKAVPQAYKHFNTADEAGRWFRDQKFNNKTVLIKGSRGIQLEKILSESS